MSFTYVKIPADTSEPIEELTASKAGGLEQDKLLASARAYFQQQQQAEHHPASSCDIIALSIPLPSNDYRTVSLYARDDDGHDKRENSRATQLVTACGHSLKEPIRGDVFVGRAYDDEAREWERVDFTAEDADPTADWCTVARTKGGGRGHGGSSSSASSLSGLLQQQLGAAQQPAMQTSSTSSTLYGMDGAPPVSETWGSWTQTADEVELKLSVPPETKSKDCKIIFKRNQVSVAVPGDNNSKDSKVIEGTLFGDVVPDECTYTLESVGGVRELCITLAKADEGKTWSWLTMKK